MYFHLCNNPLGIDRTFLIFQLKETEVLLKGVAGPSSLGLQSRSFLHHHWALRAVTARWPNSWVSHRGNCKACLHILAPCQSGLCCLRPALIHPLKVGMLPGILINRSADPLTALVSGDWAHSRSPDSASALPVSHRYSDIAPHLFFFWSQSRCFGFNNGVSQQSESHIITRCVESQVDPEA